MLRNVNAQDIITMRIPKDVNFADYMVVTTAKSLRHIKAITSDVKWIVSKCTHSLMKICLASQTSVKFRVKYLLQNSLYISGLNIYCRIHYTFQG